MRDVAELLIAWTLTSWAIFALLRRDKGGMTPEQLARAWPDVSRLSAVIVFSVFCIPVHFWRTRRSALGVILGLIWGLDIFLAVFDLLEILDLIVPS